MDKARPAKLIRELKHVTKGLFRLEAAGLWLVLSAVLALVVANTGMAELYHYVLNEVEFRIGFSDPGGFDAELRKSLLLWINDGFMALFFFLIGLEIKEELVEGRLASRDSVLLPTLAALGGMAIPALIFILCVGGDEFYLRGWAIPAATDIAFALGVISLVKSRVPSSLVVLLMAIAIIDDIGAILIIALFYSDQIHLLPLNFAAAALGGLFLLNRSSISNIVPYAFLGAILWISILESGIHATLAGVVTALFIPMHTKDGQSPCEDLQHHIHPFVSFFVLPVFAFANAGVPLAGLDWSSFLHPVTLGIMLGLAVGKQVGVFALIALSVVLKLSPKPLGASWLQVYGISLLCGIGFTMSLFIGGLAYAGTEMQTHVRVGVMAGSVISALAGYLILRYAPPVKLPADKPEGITGELNESLPESEPR